MIDSKYTVIDTGGFGLSEINTTVTLAVFAEKRVVKEQPPALDQLVNSALSRMKISLQAEVDWTVRDMKKSWKEQLSF